MFMGKRIVEKLLLKERYVLQGFSKQLIKPLNEGVVEKQYGFYIVSGFKDLEGILEYHYSINLRFRNVIKQRIQAQNWSLFLLVDQKTKQAAASYWAYISKEKPLRYDSFLIAPKNALLCNAYVNKAHRGNGLYKYLIYKSHQYLFEISANNVFTIVEASNIASLKANISSGLQIVLKNTLIKFFSINIIAFYKQKDQTKLVLLGPSFGKRVLYKDPDLF